MDTLGTLGKVVKGRQKMEFMLDVFGRMFMENVCGNEAP